MNRVLIVSPHFPPVNAADMHRVRQSLPYFREFGWDATVVAVEPDDIEMPRDEDLLATVPVDADVRHVRAFDYHLTRKVGVGNVAFRSAWQYRRAVDRVLAGGAVDLVYFSTTAFPIAALGPYWKRRWGVPFVVDVQDPWRSDHYLDVPKDQRPPKFWLAYQLDAMLEPFAMRQAAGIVSVSEAYCRTLRSRYPNLTPEACAVIPFGGAEGDVDALDTLDLPARFFEAGDGHLHVVYVGRGGHDMARAARGVFGALADGLAERPDLWDPVRLWFIGTDYAPEGKGKKTLEPLARELGVGDRVSEYPARVPYFEALDLLRRADMVVLPGSDDPAYTASKLYPYILSRRPMLAVFNGQSSVVDVLRRTGAGEAVTFGSGDDAAALRRDVRAAWERVLERLPFTPDTDWEAFAPYTAREMTRRQAAFFDQTLARVAAAGGV